MNKISISDEVFARHKASLAVIAGEPHSYAPRLQGIPAHWRDRPLLVSMVDPDLGTLGDPVPLHLFDPEVSWPLPLPPVLRPVRRVYAGDFAWGTPLMPAMPPMPADAPIMPPEPELLAPGFVTFVSVVLAAAAVAALAAIYFNLPAFL